MITLCGVWGGGARRKVNCFCGQIGRYSGCCGVHVRFKPLAVEGFPDIGNKFVRCVCRDPQEAPESEEFLRLYREDRTQLARLVRERERGIIHA